MRVGHLADDLAQPLLGQVARLGAEAAHRADQLARESGTTLNAPSWLVCIEQMLTTTASTGLDVAAGDGLQRA